MIIAMVLHCVGNNLAKCRSFFSSLHHSIFSMLGSSRSYHLALDCFANFLCSSEVILDHSLFPQFITTAFRISSSIFLHMPPLNCNLWHHGGRMSQQAASLREVVMTLQPRDQEQPLPTAMTFSKLIFFLNAK